MSEELDLRIKFLEQRITIIEDRMRRADSVIEMLIVNQTEALTRIADSLEKTKSEDEITQFFNKDEAPDGGGYGWFILKKTTWIRLNGKTNKQPCQDCCNTAGKVIDKDGNEWEVPEDYKPNKGEDK